MGLDCLASEVLTTASISASLSKTGKEDDLSARRDCLHLKSCDSSLKRHKNNNYPSVTGNLGFFHYVNKVANKVAFRHIRQLNSFLVDENL